MTLKSGNRFWEKIMFNEEAAKCYFAFIWSADFRMISGLPR